SVAESQKVIAFAKSDKGESFMKKEFSKHTKHGSLSSIDCYTTGRLVFIVYNADTKAAMGMNMVTISSTNTSKALIEKLKDDGIAAKLVSESGNMCVDKKPAMLNVIRGRGISIIAEATIKKDVLEEYFNATAEQIR